jgi:hypothetical protein
MARYLHPGAKFRAPVPPGAQSGAPPQAPLGGTRSEALRRLQMGAIGVVAVLLLIGLASIIKDRAAQTETTAVAGAAATRSPGGAPAAADPLAEAGVVPDMPVGTTVGAAEGSAAAPPATPLPGGR